MCQINPKLHCCDNYNFNNYNSNRWMVKSTTCQPDISQTCFIAIFLQRSDLGFNVPVCLLFNVLQFRLMCLVLSVAVELSYFMLNENVCRLFAALPYGLQFTSKPVSHHGNQYAVQWIVSSYSPLVNFTLYLKQVPINYTMSHKNGAN